MTQVKKRLRLEESQQADREDEVSLAPIELSSYTVEVEGQATFEYLLCYECLVLLSSMIETELEIEQ